MKSWQIAAHARTAPTSSGKAGTILAEKDRGRSQSPQDGGTPYGAFDSGATEDARS